MQQRVPRAKNDHNETADHDELQHSSYFDPFTGLKASCIYAFYPPFLKLSKDLKKGIYR